jgi:hypothetical protein
MTPPRRLPRDICLQCGTPGIAGLCGMGEAIYDRVIGVADLDISKNRRTYLRVLVEEAIQSGSPPTITRAQLRHMLRHLTDAEFEARERAEIVELMAEARR